MRTTTGTRNSSTTRRGYSPPTNTNSIKRRLGRSLRNRNSSSHIQSHTRTQTLARQSPRRRRNRTSRRNHRSSHRPNTRKRTLDRSHPQKITRPDVSRRNLTHATRPRTSGRSRRHQQAHTPPKSLDTPTNSKGHSN